MQRLELVLAGLERHLGIQLLDGGEVLRRFLDDVVLREDGGYGIARGTIGNGDGDLLSRFNGLFGFAEQTGEDEDGGTRDDGDRDEDADDHRKR